MNHFYDIIKNEQASFLIIKNDNIIYQDNGLGVKPIMKIIQSQPALIQDAIVIDKVIGKAAALLLIKYKAAQVHGLLMSQSAIEVLTKHQISYFYEQKTAYIQNRSNSGLCPLEDSVKDTDDLDIAYANIQKRISELMQAAQN